MGLAPPQFLLAQELEPPPAGGPETSAATLRSLGRLPQILNLKGASAPLNPRSNNRKHASVTFRRVTTPLNDPLKGGVTFGRGAKSNKGFWPPSLRAFGAPLSLSLRLVSTANSDADGPSARYRGPPSTVHVALSAASPRR